METSVAKRIRKLRSRLLGAGSGPDHNEAIRRCQPIVSEPASAALI
jgi:hypothetical protein